MKQKTLTSPGRLGVFRSQVHCYEDNRFLKIFSDILRLLYDAEIVGEDTIQHW